MSFFKFLLVGESLGGVSKKNWKMSSSFFFFWNCCLIFKIFCQTEKFDSGKGEDGQGRGGMGWDGEGRGGYGKVYLRGNNHFSPYGFSEIRRRRGEWKGMVKGMRMKGGRMERGRGLKYGQEVARFVEKPRGEENGSFIPLSGFYSCNTSSL